MSSSEQPVEKSRFGALKSRNFTLIWAGLILSNTGTWMQNTAQGWLIYQITGRPLDLGIVALSSAIPMLILPPFGGVLADRFHRVNLLKVTQTFYMLSAFTLAWLIWTGRIEIWHIVVASFFNSLLLAVDNPTRQALIPDLVPRKELPSAISLNSTVYMGGALIGPAVAGFLLPILQPGGIFFMNGLSYLAILIPLFLMRDVPHRGQQGNASQIERVLAGFSYAFTHRFVLVLLLLLTLASIFGRSYSILMPVFAGSAVWNVGEQGLGLLLSASGAGAMVGALGMAAFGDVPWRGRLLLGALLVFCICLALFASLPASMVWLALVLVFICSVSSTAATTVIATLLQLRVPGELRGRVMSLYTVSVIGMSSLGGMVISAIANTYGAPRAIEAGAVILLAVVIALIPFLLGIRSVPHIVEQPARART